MLSAGRGQGKNGKMVQGLRSIIGEDKIDRKLRTAKEMEKSKNSHTQPMDTI